MSQKVAKKLRKEHRRLASEMAKELQKKLYEEEPKTPVAGCPSCGQYKFFLILDAMPPNHTEITHLGCCNKDCGMRLTLNYKIPQPPGYTEDIEVIEECPGCGFEATDCQCE